MNFCEAPNCNSEVHAAGLCLKHYMRVRRHGSVTGGRNGDGRVKSKSPLWEGWKSLLRNARKSGGIDLRWKDFWLFVANVGDKPHPSARLYRTDETRPYGPGNFEWRTSVIDVSQLQDSACYQRAWRLKRGEVYRDWYLRNTFGGMTTKVYNSLLSSQNGVCAICRQPETSIDPRTGRPFPLAVDHCHAAAEIGKMKIRGLLCTRCNTGLGSFLDDPASLRAAISYLERYTMPIDAQEERR